MTPTKDIFRNLKRHLETTYAPGRVDSVVRFDGNVFSPAIDFGLVERGRHHAVLLIGLLRDMPALRSGALQRVTSTLYVALVVVVLVRGRQNLSACAEQADDLMDALSGVLEYPTLASGDGGIGQLSAQVEEVRALADPDGNYLARQMTLALNIKRYP